MADAYGETRIGGNHPRSSTQGGASSVPTPANNSGGGRGWGDKGFFKGGMEGPGHQHAENAQSTTDEFLSLQQQKSMAGSHFEQRAVNVNREGSPPPSPATCETEDHGFANHKPGSAGGLFGAATVKHAIQDTLHGQGR